jgi:transposase InsO family protein
VASLSSAWHAGEIRPTFSIKAKMLDLFNREIVGWSVKPRMSADLAVDASTWHRSDGSERRD